MASRTEHYLEAERLIEAGEEVVRKIRQASARRTQLAQDYGTTLTPSQKATLEGITLRMDELGKKAMGVWAQAQVHATLASVPAVYTEDSVLGA